MIMNKLTYLNYAPLFLIAFLLLGSHLTCQAQDVRSAKNGLYLELLGNGGLYSVNYEHFLSDHMTGRVGFSVATLTSETSGGTTEREGTLFTAPIMLNYLSGKGSNHLEIGGGMTIFSFSRSTPQNDILDFASGTAVLFTGTIGYRYQPPDGGFLFRIGFTPLTNFKAVAPLGGLSLGYAF